MGKYSPGPWKWFSKVNGFIQDRGSERQMRFLVAANNQGFCHTVGLDSETDIANADLIASAPELLEMVEALFCDPEGNPCFEGSDGDKTYFLNTLKKARGEHE